MRRLICKAKFRPQNLTIKWSVQGSVFFFNLIFFLAWFRSASGQDLSGVLSETSQISSLALQLFLVLTIISIAPAIAIMITSFPFIITVLAILRQAIGLQSSPPNMLMVSLAVFLTYFVMEPVLQVAWVEGGGPFARGEMPLDTAFNVALIPFQEFMLERTDTAVIGVLSELRDFNYEEIDVGEKLSILIPSFMLSELSRAFEVGFLIFLPFLIIDLVVAAILMSMGMMMVPPAIVSLPFKLAFFVIADGWTIVADSLVRGYF